MCVGVQCVLCVHVLGVQFKVGKVTGRMCECVCAHVCARVCVLACSCVRMYLHVVRVCGVRRGVCVCVYVCMCVCVCVYVCVAHYRTAFN